MPRKYLLYCQTEGIWKERKSNRSEFQYLCPTDPSHVVSTVMDKGEVQDSQMLMNVSLADNNPLEIKGGNVLNLLSLGGSSRYIYFPGTVALQQTPKAIKMVVQANQVGQANALMLYDVQDNTPIVSWYGIVPTTPSIVTVDLTGGAPLPKGESILQLQGASSNKLYVHSLSIF